MREGGYGDVRGALTLLNKHVLPSKKPSLCQHTLLYKHVLPYKHAILNNIWCFTIICYFTMCV